MQDKHSILSSFFGDKISEVKSFDDLFVLVGDPKFSITHWELERYRKRDDFSPRHRVYMSTGVYAIQFPKQVYIGMVGDSLSYFGRRWKSHFGIGINTAVSRAIEAHDPNLVMYHVLEVSHDPAFTALLEQIYINAVDTFCNESVLNITQSEHRKKRPATEINKEKALAMRSKLKTVHVTGGELHVKKLKLIESMDEWL